MSCAVSSWANRCPVFNKSRLMIKRKVRLFFIFYVFNKLSIGLNPLILIAYHDGLKVCEVGFVAAGSIEVLQFSIVGEPYGVYILLRTACILDEEILGNILVGT